MCIGAAFRDDLGVESEASTTTVFNQNAYRVVLQYVQETFKLNFTFI
jgi:hypothetical protein